MNKVRTKLYFIFACNAKSELRGRNLTFRHCGDRKTIVVFPREILQRGPTLSLNSYFI